jgi:hypothetical protein
MDEAELAEAIAEAQDQRSEERRLAEARHSFSSYIRRNGSWAKSKAAQDEAREAHGELVRDPATGQFVTNAGFDQGARGGHREPAKKSAGDAHIRRLFEP